MTRGLGVLDQRPESAAAHDLLSVRNLRVEFPTSEGTLRAVDGVDFDLAAGRTLCLVGESGSGKSVTALSLLRLVDPPGRIDPGSRIQLAGHELTQVDEDRMRAIRGSEIAMIFQEPMTALNPVYSIGDQIIETLRLHGRGDRRRATDRAVEMLDLVGIPRARSRLGDYPHQLSGGMRQRVMIAMALVCEPKLLVADEPTTALDVTIQAQVLELIRRLRDELGMAVLLITHDLGVVAEMADDVVVMYAGRVVERGSARDILDHPQHPYTEGLLGSLPSLEQPRGTLLRAIRGSVPNLVGARRGCPFAPRCDYAFDRCRVEEPPLFSVGGQQSACWLREEGVPAPPATIVRPPLAAPAAATPAAAPEAVLLQTRDLRTYFPIHRGILRTRVGWLRAVDGVDLTIARGETVGLVGESGCGKSTLGRSIIRLVRPYAGEIHFEGANVATARGAELARIRRGMQIIFQDPVGSLDPRMNVGEIIEEGLAEREGTGPRERRERVREMLERVGLSASMLNRYPHELSGGQRQRVGIARALVLEPTLVIGDEPVSALDVSVQAQVLNLLMRLKADLQLTYLFITHNLGVVNHISDRVVVMYLGKVVESGSADDIRERPLHPYTVALLAAAPHIRRTGPPPVVLKGEVPSAADPPSGCRFRTRCPLAQAVCAEVEPPLVAHAAGHVAACHFAGELTSLSAASQKEF